MLRRLCLPLGCAVRPLQRIDSLAIDAVTFSKVDIDRYRLSFGIKNQSNWMLALPGVELSLTDAADQLVVRRVFSRTELFETATEFPPAQEKTVSVLVQMKPREITPRVAGYRLLAFYPD